MQKKPFNFSNTDNLIQLEGIPDEWVYMYYLDLKEELTGRVVRIKSPFTMEKTPSMYLYVREGRYVWKDHSSGVCGDAFNLVKLILEAGMGESVGWKEVIETIKRDHKEWTRKGFVTPEYKLEPEHFAYNLVYEASVRDLQTWDTKYWSQFGITTDLLHEYNVIPLKKARLGRHFHKSNTTTWYNWIFEYHSYGFFKRDGTLYKIYNPHSIDVKHVTLEPWLLGREQLRPDKYKTLIIASSMKDLLTLKSLDLEMDVAGPASESSILSINVITELKSMYANILTLFDNDRTGVKSMLAYKALYNIDFAYLPYEKDVSEFREKGFHVSVRRVVTEIINKKLFKGIFDVNEKTTDNKQIEVYKKPTAEEIQARAFAEDYKGGLYDDLA